MWPPFLPSDGRAGRQTGFAPLTVLTPSHTLRTINDVQAIDCDFLACSSYRFFGPHQGILWGRPGCSGPASAATTRAPKWVDRLGEALRAM
jgi:hypothetical protein